MTESENFARDFFLAPRSVDGILDFSTDPVCHAACRVDTGFNRDSCTDTVFSTPVHGGNAAQTAFSPRTAATAFTLQHKEGAKIGEPHASFTPTRPESTDYTRQPTARSSRRIARHAALIAAEASANFNLASAIGALADLASAVHAPTDLASAVHAPDVLTSAVHAPADSTSALYAQTDLASAVHAPADLTPAIQVSAGLTTAVPTTICSTTGVLSPVQAGNAPAPSFSPHQTHPATPLHPTTPLRSATPPRRAPSLAPAAC